MCLSSTKGVYLHTDFQCSETGSILPNGIANPILSQTEDGLLPLDIGIVESS
jgi:hypothetical protein